MQIRNFLSDSVATNPNVGRVFPPWLARFSLQQLPRWYLGVSPHGISCLVDSKQTNNRTGHNVPSTVDDPIPIAGIFQKEMPEVTEAGKRDVGFVVSNNYCRYISLPWSDVMLAKQTRLAYLRSAFAEIYGNAAYDWEMTVQAAPYGQSRIACAMDSAVLQTLRQECAASGARILFCRPYFDKALDFFRGYGLARIGNSTTFPEVFQHLPPIVNRNFPPGSSDLSWNPCLFP